MKFRIDIPPVLRLHCSVAADAPSVSEVRLIDVVVVDASPLPNNDDSAKCLSRSTHHFPGVLPAGTKSPLKRYARMKMGRAVPASSL